MKTIKIISVVATLLWANACREFEELQLDPNRAIQTHPSLILTNVEVSTFQVINVGAALASRMIVFTDGAAVEQYYNWQRAGFDRYNSLRQVTKMKEEAERLDLQNYLPLALFFNSVNIIELTKVFGDVPYSESANATSGIYNPVYDKQEDIYLKVLDDLKEANNTLDEAKGNITGDVIYGGDLLKWKKLINSYSLRILMSLSNKTNNTKLNVVSRFNEIVGNPDQYPLFASNEDNAALHFYDLVDNRYPYFNNNNFKTAYYMEESFVDLLRDNEDPRLFTFADPKPQGSSLPPTDFNAYGGLDGSAPLADNTNRLVNGEGSRVDERYYTDPVNEPSMLISYAEVEFTLAEAAARDWILSDAAEHYENGIRASFEFYHLPEAEQDAYLLQPSVVYDPAKAIEMIVTQKYINFFLNGGWEAFYNHLRTGFPEFSVDGGGVLNNGQ
ncbi:MAG TPA: SusD/RagB family nutrient-binding outer membrane lipoprotein, partial [Chryseosolibacter sp.]